MPKFEGLSYGGDSPKSVTQFTIPKEEKAMAPVKDGKKVDPALLVPQEDRDAAARAANDEFKLADKDAKEAEAAARKVRAVANKAKKEKNAAKDLACETRPGGKWICLRGFGSGY